jgi:hypothetical protein
MKSKLMRKTPTLNCVEVITESGRQNRAAVLVPVQQEGNTTLYKYASIVPNLALRERERILARTFAQANIRAL